MNGGLTMIQEAKQTAQHLADAVGDQLSELSVDRKLAARLKAIEKNVAQVDSRIEALGKRFPRSRGPRFPFGLLIVAGLGYALYNPSTRSKLLGLVGNVSPAARDAIEGVIGKGEDAVADMQGGRDMGDTVRNAAQNVSQGVKDGLQDLKTSGDRTAHQASSAGDQAADKLKDVSNEASRGVDRLADRTQDKVNDIKH
jgi:gas vesicle protein